MKLETVKIAAGKDFVIINKADFDTKKGHKIYVEPKAKAKGKTKD